MTSIQIVKSDNDPAKNEEQTAPNTMIKTDIGMMTSESSMVKNTVVNLPKFFQHMPQNELNDFMTRPTEIRTVTLTSTDTQFSDLLVFDPWVDFLSNAKIASKTSTYLYVRGTIELLIISAMPGNCYGSYVISTTANGGAIQTTDRDILPNTVPYQQQLAVDNYVRIDCSASENSIIQLPFLWPYDYATLPLGPSDSWKVSINCISALRTAIPGGNSIGTLRVFARLLDDYELVVPHLQGKNSHKGHILQHPFVKHFAPQLSAAQEQHEGAISGVADKVADAANMLSGVPVIGAAAQAVSAVAGTVSKIASWFGFTRVADQLMPIPTTQHSTSSLVNYDGNDPSLIAGLSITNAISIDPTMSGVTDHDVLSTADFFDRWTLITSATWSPSQTTGTDLFSFPITPFFGNVDGSGVFYCTNAGYFGLPFNYWRGDMEYLVIIPVSKLHRGSLQIAWIPTGSSSIPALTNSTLNTIYDVSAGDEKVVKVGFARDIPFLQCVPMISSTIQNYNITNGRLLFRVINPLTSQSDTPVDILIYAKASSNMEFSVPRSTFLNTLGMDPAEQALSTIAYQGASGDDDAHEVDMIELVPSSGDYPMEDLLFGERVHSIRALLQKPSRIIPNIVDGNPIDLGSQIIEPLGPSRATWDSLYPFRQLASGWNLNYHYRLPFTGFAASQRYKILPSGDCWIGGQPVNMQTLNYVNPADLGASTWVNELNPMTFCGQNKGYEIMFPYYNNKKYILSRESTEERYRTRFNVLRILPVPESAVPPTAFYHAMGPDIRCVGYRYVPGLHFDQYFTDLPNFFLA